MCTLNSRVEVLLPRHYWDSGRKAITTWDLIGVAARELEKSVNESSIKYKKMKRSPVKLYGFRVPATHFYKCSQRSPLAAAGRALILWENVDYESKWQC